MSEYEKLVERVRELEEERDRWRERWAAAVDDASEQRAIIHQLTQENETEEWLGD